MTAGLEGTRIQHVPWLFSAAEPLNHYFAPYPLSIAYAVNDGFQEFLDAQLALSLFEHLPTKSQPAHGPDLLKSVLAINPFDINVVEATQQAISSPVQELELWNELEKTLAAVSKPGCPSTKGFYHDLVLKGLSKRLDELPVPKDKDALQTVATFVASNADATWVKYQLAIVGMPALKQKLADDLAANIAGTRTWENANPLAARITAVGAAIENKEEKLAWGRKLLGILSGHELAAIHKGKRIQKTTDPCAKPVYQLAGEKDLKAVLEADKIREAEDAEALRKKAERDLSQEVEKAEGDNRSKRASPQ